MNVHPIVRQIIDRDCHVSMSNRAVIRHVVSKLKDGHKTFRAMPKVDRRRLMEGCISVHRQNWKLYAYVMHGTSQPKRKTKKVQRGFKVPLSGQDLVRLMRQHKTTIRDLSQRTGITQKRIREVRVSGLTDPHTVRDWIEAVTGVDPGPIPAR